jgi:hypothetical protein
MEWSSGKLHPSWQKLAGLIFSAHCAPGEAVETWWETARSFRERPESFRVVGGRFFADPPPASFAPSVF